MNQGRYILAAGILVIVGFIFFMWINRIKVCGTGSSSKTIIDYDSNDTNSRRAIVQSEGKILFNNICAACHAINVKVVGPPLLDIEARGPWGDRKKLFGYLRNPITIKNNEYVKQLWKEYPIRHPFYPNLKDSQLNSLFNYIAAERKKYSGPIP
jgi:cytochrome c551/c552